jgi:hypothetical protein
LAGHDPKTIIDNSIEHGWLTFYEPNGNGNGKGKESIFERALRKANAEDGR